MLMLEPASILSILMLEVSRELLLRFQTGNASMDFIPKRIAGGHCGPAVFDLEGVFVRRVEKRQRHWRRLRVCPVFNSEGYFSEGQRQIARSRQG